MARLPVEIQDEWLVVSILKIWFWMEMNRHTHAREIKRLELQVAMMLQMLKERRH